jgi:hypothetical protein
MTMNRSISQCRHFLALALPILASLDDSHRALEPQPGLKTAGWLVGHLATSGDFARKLCGRPPLCPADWRAKFNPGTTPSVHAADYPPMRELADVFERVFRDLADSAAGVDPQRLAIENPIAFTRDAFPTSGDFIAYLMSGHMGYHVGQLVAWRSAAGLGRLPRPDAIVV